MVSEAIEKTVVGTGVMVEALALSGTVLSDVVGTDAVVVSKGIIVTMQCTDITVVPEPLVDTVMVLCSAATIIEGVIRASREELSFVLISVLREALTSVVTGVCRDVWLFNGTL